MLRNRRLPEVIKGIDGKELVPEGGGHYDRCAMNSRCCLSLVCLMSLGVSGLVMGADEASDAAAVPEPSAFVLAGLCGLLFLLWRNK